MLWSWPAFFEALVSPFMLAGALTTIWLSVLSMAFGILLGFVAALMKMSRNPVVARDRRLLHLALARHAAAHPAW